MFKAEIEFTGSGAIKENTTLSLSSLDFKHLFIDIIKEAKANHENIIGVAVALTTERYTDVDTVYVNVGATMLSSFTYSCGGLSIKNTERKVYRRRFGNLEDFKLTILNGNEYGNNYSVSIHNSKAMEMCHTQENEAMYYNDVDGKTVIDTMSDVGQFLISYIPGESGKEMYIDSDYTDTPVTYVQVNTFYRLWNC